MGKRGGRCKGALAQFEFFFVYFSLEILLFCSNFRFGKKNSLDIKKRLFSKIYK
jgi:hypothetical protein